MATGSKNAKSQSLTARIPHEIIEGMELVKEKGESTGQFITTSMLGEIKRRQRKKSKAEPSE
ncbi:YlcI/YnfO family protein [Yersinia sp. 2553 StPb PI]|uniref:YlcI/YnfO family protein n=1 Tax=unclassified Yersinia (in: enterobacteria) TaxID=2653513 RepID=UPI003B28C974